MWRCKQYCCNRNATKIAGASSRQYPTRLYTSAQVGIYSRHMRMRENNQHLHCPRSGTPWTHGQKTKPIYLVISLNRIRTRSRDEFLFSEHLQWARFLSVHPVEGATKSHDWRTLQTLATSLSDIVSSRPLVYDRRGISTIE